MGFDGNILTAIKNIYSSCMSTVNVNGYLTEKFPINLEVCKFAKLKGIGFSTFTIHFRTGVVPILDYCSGIWGYQSFGQIDTFQNRAIHFYLGLHKFEPNLAINGDAGWISSSVRRKSEMLHYWNRLIHMDYERLTKTVFHCDFN